MHVENRHMYGHGSEWQVEVGSDLMQNRKGIQEIWHDKWIINQSIFSKDTLLCVYYSERARISWRSLSGSCSSRVLVDFHRDVCQSILLSKVKHKNTRGKYMNHTINKMYKSITDGHDVKGWWLISHFFVNMAIVPYLLTGVCIRQYSSEFGLLPG